MMDGSARERAYVKKMRTEMAVLDARGVITQGNAFSSVLLVKGEPGPAERAGDALFSGADGKALRAALLALGYAPEEWLGLATWGSDGIALDRDVLRLAITTLDPATLVACDDAAAAALRDAYANELAEMNDLEDALLCEGRVVRVAGMRVLNLGGFESALVDDGRKQVMWARLKQIPPLGEPY